jgi:hypothetical protein
MDDVSAEQCNMSGDIRIRPRSSESEEAGSFLFRHPILRIFQDGQEESQELKYQKLKSIDLKFIEFVHLFISVGLPNFKISQISK